MDVTSLWNEYGMEELNHKLSEFFPDIEWNMKELFGQVVSGDVWGAMVLFVKQFFASVGQQAESIKSMVVWLLILGIISALFVNFGDIFVSHQISDLSFYFLYLVLISVLVRGYMEMAEIAEQTVERIILFMQLFIPTYLVAVGAAGGSATAYGYYQVIMLLLYGIEKLMLLIILPLIHGYVFLVFMNGIWGEDRLVLLMDFLKKGITLGMKAAIGVITGISLFQSMILPAVDSLKNTTLQKAVGAIPGIGDAADGITQIVMGSAVLIKNSIGVIILLLLLVMCAVPVLKIALLSFAFKGSAAVMGMAGDKRICESTNQAGDGGLLLLRATLTVIALFMIIVAIAAYTTGGMA
ncbi:MAG: stage III sporulation protein AE [Lachnospiraceae bacterium]|nr:stage III sporulation protein AE [Lachnospiraceae bacterium]